MPDGQTKCIEWDLTEVAAEYVTGAINEDSTLGDLLAHSFDVSRGRIRTYLPAHASLKSAHAFATCVLDVVDQEAVWRWLVAKIRSHLRASSHNVVVFQNRLARPEYPYVAKFRSAFRLYGHEYYHFVSNRNRTPTDIYLAYRDTMCHTHVAFMTSVPSMDSLDWSEAVRRDELEHMAANTVGVIVEGYDEEGFLIWRDAGARTG